MDKEKIVQKVLDKYKELDKLWEEVLSPFGVEFDSRLGNAFWKTFDDYVTIVQQHIGDENAWLSWFIFDNLCGSKGLKGVINGKQKKIKTVKQLINLINSQLPLAKARGL